MVPLLLSLSACAPSVAPATSAGVSEGASSQPVTATTADGVTVIGQRYDGGLPTSAPLALLFHQAGSSGRGEYAPLVAWLNGLGVRVVAWDLRSGGDLHGVPNRTADGLAEGTPTAFCDGTADLAAALDWAVGQGGAERVLLVGSSFSAALVVRLAADRPDAVLGVLAFSPASGGPMAECRARDRIDAVTAPILVLRPASEMERPPVQEQRDVLTAAGAEVVVVADGVHGASMLVDERTGHDMTEARSVVAAWLRRLTG